MLLAPLCPFFVLFCSVVATSNKSDFEMIKKITDDLRQFAKANASIGKVYCLFSKFLDLCAPLITKKAGSAAPDQTTILPSADSIGAEVPGWMGSSYPEVSDRADQTMGSFRSPAWSGEASSAPQSVEGWNDSLMWELFDHQPSLEWVDSELWDTMTFLDAAS